jgi:hypothetical protein
VSASSKLKGPKLPPFDDEKDNMDSYLHRFERYADNQKWSRDDWALHLSALLKGKALDVYSRLPRDDVFNYDVLKEALLKRYELTKQGFRKKFRYSKPEKGETFGQFVVRIANYFQRWIECGKAEKTFEGLTDFLLRDQLLNTVGRELCQFLKEKVFSNVQDMAKQADLFAEAHGGTQNVVSKDFKSGNQSTRPMPKERTSSAEAGRSNRDTVRQGIQCFLCKDWGHIQAKCPKRKGLTHKAAVAIQSKGACANFAQVEPGMLSLGTCLFSRSTCTNRERFREWSRNCSIT